jgi:hypothetical protein
MGNDINLNKVVNKLVGPINPVGETNEDDVRFENLKQMTHLIDHLLFAIAIISKDKESELFSVRRAGLFADEFIRATAQAIADDE